MLFFQPIRWDGVAPPLQVQVTTGTEEEFERLYVPAASSESLVINGHEVIKAIEDMGGVQIIRHIFQDSADEKVRIVALDYN